MTEENVLNISWGAILKVLSAGLILYLLYLTRSVVLWFFFALIISLLLEPAINFLRWAKLPKVLAVTLVYLSIFGMVGFIIYLTSPIFIFEIKQFSANVPEYFVKINPLLKSLGFDAASSFEEFISSLLLNLQESSKSIFRASAVFFGGIYSAIFIFTMAFFISLEEKAVERVLVLISPKKYENSIAVLFERAQAKVSGWFGARILACLFVGVISFIVFYLFRVEYAFILAFIAGVLNFVPYAGPAITAVLLFFFVGVSNSWVVSFYILTAFFVIQYIEGNILSPMLMKKFLDLPPILVLVALVVGGILFGFLGTVFAVPVFGIIYEFLKEFLEKRKENRSLQAETNF